MKKVLSVYELCYKKAKKVTSRELFQWLEIDLDENYGIIDFGDRYLRLLDQDILELSCLKKDFDRWANSGETTFDLNKKSDWRLFVKEVEKLKT